MEIRRWHTRYVPGTSWLQFSVLERAMLNSGSLFRGWPTGRLLEDNLLWSRRACSLSWKSLGPTVSTMSSVSTESFPKSSSCCRETMRHLNFLWKAVLPSRTGSLLLISFFLNRNKISNNKSPLIYKDVLLHRTDFWLVWVRDFSDYRLSVKWETRLWNDIISETTSGS